jgi:small conductance mechanosensitive channel
VQKVFRKVNSLLNSIRQAMTVRQTINIAIVGILALVLLTAWVPTALGSLPILKLWEQQLQKPHRDIERLGNVETAPVNFEARELFTVASPTVWDRSKPGDKLPVEMRAGQVEANLNRTIEGSFLHRHKDGILTNFDPKTLQVSVVSLNDVPVIIAGDGYHSQPLKLVTVTYVDADYNGQPVAALAEQWRSIIYQNLYAALMERSPDALSLRGKLGESLLALFVTLAASLMLWLLQLPLRRRNRRLRLQQSAIASEVNLDQISAPEQDLIQLHQDFINGFERQQVLQQQRSVISFFRWLLAWGQVFIWLSGVAIALTLFPWTKEYSRQLLGAPLILLLIWFLTSWINRLGSALLHSLASAWVRFGVNADQPHRDRLRIFTILAAVKPLKTFMIYATGIVAALVYLGMPLSLVLVIGGIVSLAVLLICQDVVRDWVAGCLILWEDQYTIGDVISTEDQTGLVQRMNLRLTQLHDSQGRFISIANRSMARVVNLTRNWYRQRQESVAVRSANANPFNGADPFNGIDPFGNEPTEPTVSEG